MILPGHLAAGYLVTSAILAIAGPTLSAAQMQELLIIGTLLGDAPDIDIFFHFIREKTLSPGKLSVHRTYITHAPLVWLVLGLLIFIVATDPFIKTLGLLVWLCPWSHFVLDSIDFGVMWLWPFSKKQYALLTPHEKEVAPSDWGNVFRNYFKTPLAWLEIALTAGALLLFLSMIY